jgi:hypothetical protein
VFSKKYTGISAKGATVTTMSAHGLLDRVTGGLSMMTLYYDLESGKSQSWEALDLRCKPAQKMF